jgi:glycosyltransferase involved in cell wall biosynthesis
MLTRTDPVARRGRTAARAPFPVYLNGKFYSGPLNGVHRTADRLIQALDAFAQQGAADDLEFRLLLPERANWAPDFARVRKIPQRLGHNQLWEQAVLPFAASDGALVNLANLGPVLHGRKLAMIHDAQFLLSPQSYAPHRRWGYRLVIPMVARTSALTLTVSEYARDSLAAFGVSRHERTRVIYNGCDHILQTPPDPGALARLGLQPGGYVVLFGAPAAYKNIQVVLAAFASDPPEGVKLVIVGADRAGLQARGLSPPADAVIAGKVDDGVLRALYDSALALLFPSRTEGFGLPPAEAMACGCPVVIAPAGALPEVCRDAALYADIFDPPSWRLQIERLRDDPGLRQAKIQAGLARAARFTWRSAGEQLLQEIRRLAV